MKIFTIVFTFILTLFAGALENTHQPKERIAPSESQIRRIEDRGEERVQINLLPDKETGERSHQRDTGPLLLKGEEEAGEWIAPLRADYPGYIWAGVKRSLATERYRVLRN